MARLVNNKNKHNAPKPKRLNTVATHNGNQTILKIEDGSDKKPTTMESEGTAHDPRR